MPFGLKNAGATYQRLVNKIFKDQIRRSMEVYMDDVLVKSREFDQHIEDLRMAFPILRRYQMKLNPTTCTFAVQSGKFLDFMVSEKGIEANPEKFRAIIEMKSPTNLNKVQKLADNIAALNRFVFRSTDKYIPFFQVLKKAREWDAKCEEAFT